MSDPAVPRDLFRWLAETVDAAWGGVTYLVLDTEWGWLVLLLFLLLAVGGADPPGSRR